MEHLNGFRFSGTRLPGRPLKSGFRFRPADEYPVLSPEARQRVLDKIQSVNHARMRAAEQASQSVIGGAI